MKATERYEETRVQQITSSSRVSSIIERGSRFSVRTSFIPSCHRGGRAGGSRPSRVDIESIASICRAAIFRAFLIRYVHPFERYIDREREAFLSPLPSFCLFFYCDCQQQNRSSSSFLSPSLPPFLLRSFRSCFPCNSIVTMMLAILSSSSLL